MLVCAVLFFFFNDTATTEIYTLSLHDALPISVVVISPRTIHSLPEPSYLGRGPAYRPTIRFSLKGIKMLSIRPEVLDRKSTRLNSSHANISYAVFCLKKKKITSIMHLDAISDI